MAPGNFIKALADEIADGPLFNRNDTIVVAVSGGPDSMALLHALHALNEEADYDLVLHVAHLNHKLRGQDADDDAAFVHAAADHLGVRCHVLSSDIRALADQRGESVEEVARNERYLAFERVCLKVGAEVVAVGHHADDNAETILHRILRGTGLRGLAGIPRKRSISPMSDVSVVRPFLRRTRKEILEFLGERGIPYHEDRTNELNEPMRNRIRNVVLPLLEEQINPQAREAMLRLAEQAGWVEEYLRQTAQRTLETLIISRNDQQLTLNAASLARKDRIIQTELLRRAIGLFEPDQPELSFINVKAVLDLVADSTSGKQVQLPGGLSATKLYDRLVLSCPSDEPRETIAAEVAVHVPGVTHLPVRRIAIECAVSDVTADQIENWKRNPRKDEEWADAEHVHLPLTIRGRRTGDRFWPLGAPGSKKLSDFLTDAKIDPRERDRLVILCDQLGPVWVVGHRLDERVKLTRHTKRVLHMRVRRLGD